MNKQFDLFRLRVWSAGKVKKNGSRPLYSILYQQKLDPFATSLAGASSAASATSESGQACRIYWAAETRTLTTTRACGGNISQTCK